jgi:hypothetical protein
VKKALSWGRPHSKLDRPIHPRTSHQGPRAANGSRRRDARGTLRAQDQATSAASDSGAEAVRLEPRTVIHTSAFSELMEILLKAARSRLQFTNLGVARRVRGAGKSDRFRPRAGEQRWMGARLGAAAGHVATRALCSRA